MLHALLFLVRGIREHNMKPNFELMGAMVYYIDTFPERLHHPKEDAWLFRLLALRHPDAQPLIDRLQTEHRAGAARIRQVEQALARYSQGGDAEFAPFAAVVESYVEFERNHMRCEETEVFPLAQAHLTAGDWAEIDEAFGANEDPLREVSTQYNFEDLFRRIVNLAPPPIGVGPSGS